MKVYLLVHYQYEDYEGGGGEVQGVYGSRDKAVEEAAKVLPQAVAANPSAEQWDFPEEPCRQSWISVEEWEVE